MHRELIAYPDIKSIADYYPFGMLLRERTSEEIKSNTQVTITLDRMLITGEEINFGNGSSVGYCSTCASLDDYLTLIATAFSNQGITNTLQDRVITISNYVVNPTLPLALIYSSPNNDLLSIKSSGAYRYGFNGKENDDDVKGEGNSLDYGARQYDPRLAKWWSIDPYVKKYPCQSPYSYVLNNPIIFKDDDGKDAILSNLLRL